MNKRRIIIASIMLAMVLLLNVRFAISEPLDNNTNLIFIESRFRLWDANEKMIDNDFVIIMISGNETRNNTYSITINQNIYNGTFIGYQRLNFTRNESIISLHIVINEIPELTVSNIRIMSNINADGISQIGSPYTISLSPFDWNKKQWNIFNSVIVSAIISVIVSYLLVMRYRKMHGVIEIK